MGPHKQIFVPRLFEEKQRRHSICLHSVPPQAAGVFCMELLLQFKSDCFETLQVFRSWSKDMHIVWA